MQDTPYVPSCYYGIYKSLQTDFFPSVYDQEIKQLQTLLKENSSDEETKTGKLGDLDNKNINDHQSESEKECGSSKIVFVIKVAIYGEKRTQQSGITNTFNCEQR